MLQHFKLHLLPEEDAIDDPDEDDDADPTLPGDLWFVSRRGTLYRWTPRRCAK